MTKFPNKSSIRTLRQGRPGFPQGTPGEADPLAGRSLQGCGGRGHVEQWRVAENARCVIGTAPTLRAKEAHAHPQCQAAMRERPSRRQHAPPWARVRRPTRQTGPRNRVKAHPFPNRHGIDTFNRQEDSSPASRRVGNRCDGGQGRPPPGKAATQPKGTGQAST